MLGRLPVAAAVAACLSLPASADAAVVAGPDHGGYATFTDTLTGRSWIRLDSFFNVSFNHMASTVQAAGFTVAGLGDVSALLLSLPLDEPSNWSAYADVMGSAPYRGLIWGAFDIPNPNAMGWGYAYEGAAWTIGTGFGSRDEIQNEGTDEADLNIFAYVSGDAAPAVPEPASWALLITGFGITGFALRRRRVPETTAA